MSFFWGGRVNEEWIRVQNKQIARTAKQLTSYTLKITLKGLGHNWGQCLFPKNIWHDIIQTEFSQKVIQNVQTILERIEQYTELKSLLKVFICKYSQEPCVI